MSKLGREGTKWSFLSLIKLEKDKLVHSVVFPNFKETKKNVREPKIRCSGLSFCIFSERTSHFSLEYRAI